ncbi:MAG: urease accessory protein UreD [Pseudomonadota bacterium]
MSIEGDAAVKALPRARGEAAIKLKSVDQTTALDDLRMSGCLKALFPRPSNRLDTILVNTSGGLTGGDQLSVSVSLGPDTRFCLTTQAAERVYRAQTGSASVRSEVTIAAGASLFWLPQELILFDGCALERHFHGALDRDARLLMVEPIVFGRKLMGERLRQIRFRDHVSIDRDGKPLYRDVIDLSASIADRLNARAGGAGAGAIATVCYAAPDAESWLERSREALGKTGGASLVRPDLLVARCVAPDSLVLRRSLMALLDQMTGNTLPKSWRM